MALPRKSSKARLLSVSGHRSLACSQSWSTVAVRAFGLSRMIFSSQALHSLAEVVNVSMRPFVFFFGSIIAVVAGSNGSASVSFT